MFGMIFNHIYFFVIQNRLLKLDQLHKKKNVREFNWKILSIWIVFLNLYYWKILKLNNFGNGFRSSVLVFECYVIHLYEWLKQ